MKVEFFSDLLSALPGAVAQGLIWGLMAIGVFITFRVLDLADLTVDGTMATGGAVCIVLMTNGVNVWVALLCAFIAGMLAGLVTGILHTFMGIPAILAGILTQLALFSINLRIMDKKANMAINPNNYDLLVSLRNVKRLTIENPIFVAAVFTVLVIALLYWFFGTSLGCSIRATGANPNMSRAQGINVNFNKVLGLMLSNGLVALSSALYCQYQGFADVNAGRGAIVIGLAAVIIGEVVFGRIFRNFALRLLGVAFGAVIYYAVIQIVLTAGLDTNDLKMITAAVVAVFLAIPYWKGKSLEEAFLAQIPAETAKVAVDTGIIDIDSKWRQSVGEITPDYLANHSEGELHTLLSFRPLALTNGAVVLVFRLLVHVLIRFLKGIKTSKTSASQPAQAAASPQTNSSKGGAS